MVLGLKNLRRGDEYIRDDYTVFDMMRQVSTRRPVIFLDLPASAPALATLLRRRVI